MKSVPHIIFILLLTVLVGCDNDDSGPEESAGVRAFCISPEEAAMSVGESAGFDLTLQNIPDSLFAMSLRLTYDPSLLTYLEYLSAPDESFFGSDVVEYATAEDSTIHIAVSRKQNQSMVVGSGVVCRLRFEGAAAGSLQIIPSVDHVHFYDRFGNEITVENLELGGTSITIHEG